MGNGLCVDGKITRLRKVKVKENKGQLNNIDNEIDEFLKNLPELNCPKLKKFTQSNVTPLAILVNMIKKDIIIKNSKRLRTLSI